MDRKLGLCWIPADAGMTKKGAGMIRKKAVIVGRKSAFYHVILAQAGIQLKTKNILLLLIKYR